MDTIVTVKNDSTYAFYGNKYWKLTDTAIAPGYPRSISSDWDGMPGNLDAAFTWKNGKTYFFKGDKYWRFSEVGIMDRGYPKVKIFMVFDVLYLHKTCLGSQRNSIALKKIYE